MTELHGTAKDHANEMVGHRHRKGSMCAFSHFVITRSQRTFSGEARVPGGSTICGCLRPFTNVQNTKYIARAAAYNRWPQHLLGDNSVLMLQ